MKASIQVYEETSGLGPGEPVESMDVPLSVELGPGLLTSIYDGIQRPLDDIMKETGGNNLKRGVEVPSLKRDKKWQFVPTVQSGRQRGSRRHHRYRAGDADRCTAEDHGAVWCKRYRQRDQER